MVRLPEAALNASRRTMLAGLGSMLATAALPLTPAMANELAIPTLEEAFGPARMAWLTGLFRARYLPLISDVVEEAIFDEPGHFRASPKFRAGMTRLFYDGRPVEIFIDINNPSIPNHLPERPECILSAKATCDSRSECITRLLDTHPYSAQQIFQRLREDGYSGGLTILRDYVRCIRPTKRPVYLKLHFAAGKPSPMTLRARHPTVKFKPLVLSEIHAAGDISGLTLDCSQNVVPFASRVC